MTAADKLRELLATRPAQPNLEELVRWWTTSGVLVPEVLGELARHRHVTPEYIREQRAKGWPDIHPEDYCHRCGAANMSWYVDRKEWLDATSAWAAETGREGVCCPRCFAEMHKEQTGKSSMCWKLLAHDLAREGDPADIEIERAVQYVENMTKAVPPDGYTPTMRLRYAAQCAVREIFNQRAAVDVLKQEVRELEQQRDGLGAYIDDAKRAAGTERVSGEPLAGFVTRSTEELRELRDRCANAERDAKRYRRLQLLGCTPYGVAPPRLLRFSNLDEYVDADIAAHPTRGASFLRRTGEHNERAATALRKERDQLRDERDRLAAERDRMRPVYEAALRLRAITKRAEEQPTPALLNQQIIDNANAFRELFDAVDGVKREPTRARLLVADKESTVTVVGRTADGDVTLKVTDPATIALLKKGTEPVSLGYVLGEPAVPADDESRCAVCGWQMPDPVKGTAGFPCRPGDCSLRPPPEKLYAPERAKREAEELRERALRERMEAGHA